jgi:Mn-dependent DtxR family transcriptional regulator
VSIPSDKHPAGARFTELQGQYLAFIHAYTKLNRRPPAEADMQKFFRVTPPSVHRMVLELEHKGLISREPGKPRSIQLLVAPRALPELE